ncbi:hypothetical protein E1B28_001977 [Marasmius oreades]|uniref:EthD domain-containing protein n=1 Tax=Marasmius oreades TaxID=181124 RepID=A0A9P7V4Q3_9AGAR|nr:uncharacterized protein E1B28_001977 [Marasmius oreades]KAG7100202.1 hypothetical protein E1B28_001977 [Marasmius oreades]
MSPQVSLKPEMNTLRTDRFRFFVFVKKRADMTMEEFDRYWLEVHSKVFLKFIAGKEGLLKYEQLHVNQVEKARLKSIGVPVLDYDGVGLFDVDSFEKFAALLDEGYIRDVVPDEEKFILREESVVVRAKIASIVDCDEDLLIAAQMASAGSPYLKLPTNLRKDRSRMLFTFNVMEGVDLSQVWLRDHANVVKATPLGQSIIKYEQLHPTEPVSGFTDNHDAELPHWDGVALIDVPSFNLFKDPVSKRMLAEDEAKWQAPGTLSMLPIDVATIIDVDVAPAYEASLLLGKL